MKRDEFVKRVAAMCGPTEVEAVHQIAELPPNQRYKAAQKMGQAAADYGLMEFLSSLLDDDLIDDVAALLDRGSSRDDGEELLKRLWARLLLMLSPEAKDVLYAHNQLRVMLDNRAQRAHAGSTGSVDRAYQSAVRNARAVLASTEDVEDETTISA
jgi:hypothetical protein